MPHSAAGQAGIDWLGTIRARAGYLITPSFLTFITGGFTHGGAHANINLSSTQAATLTGEDFILPSVPMTTQTFLGSGSASRVLEGWNVGAGFEWIFMPNWSVKGEALYWNLGKLDVTTTASSAGLPQFLPFEAGESAFLNPALLVGRHSVTFQGVIIRAGLNYHFSSYYAPIVTK